jgi:hypothetical protein
MTPRRYCTNDSTYTYLDRFTIILLVWPTTNFNEVRVCSIYLTMQHKWKILIDHQNRNDGLFRLLLRLSTFQCGLSRFAQACKKVPFQLALRSARDPSRNAIFLRPSRSWGGFRLLSRLGVARQERLSKAAIDIMVPEALRARFKFAGDQM